jgi:hypothetical protein
LSSAFTETRHSGRHLPLCGDVRLAAVAAAAGDAAIATARLPQAMPWQSLGHRKVPTANDFRQSRARLAGVDTPAPPVDNAA